MPMRAINPATEELVREYPTADAQQIDRVLHRAAEAFAKWKLIGFADRSALMYRAGQVLRDRQKEFAELMTREMGKPIVSAEQEIEKCAWCCDYFAQHAERMLASEMIETDASRSYVQYDPLGAVLAIMPWNFPYWQVFRFAAPNLMAGNVGVLKHAASVPGCALAIEEVFADAGFPPGVFSTLLVENEATESIIANPIIKAVTLTGSERAGVAVGSAAGKYLKKSVLELGGSDPFIVLRDVADVEAVAHTAAAARCINAGQSCIAAKRFIVEESIADRFERAMTESMKAMIVGDPMDRATQVGPLAREDLLQSLHDQVQRSLKAGAKLLTGGKRIDRRGFFYEPTVLANVRPSNPAFVEETFGPVAAIIRAKDADDAVALANESNFGLAASVWTSDMQLAESIAWRLEAGGVFINGIVKSDPRLPFGGIKKSGYGRELSTLGIREFTNAKTVWIK